MPNDVHVIDLRDRSTDKTRVERSTNEQLPEVLVELGPELTEGKDSNNLLLSKKFLTSVWFQIYRLCKFILP